MSPIDLTVAIVELITSVFVFAGAVIGLHAVDKWKDKQLNAAFSFYSRLKTQLKLIYDLINKQQYRNFLFEYMLPQTLRANDLSVYTPMEPIVIKKLSELSGNVIKFLMTENNQMPISNKWNEQVDILLEFLQDCESMKDKSFFKWPEINEIEMSEYFRRHSDNLASIITDIEQCQTGLTKKYLKKVKSKTARKSTSSDT